MLSFHYSFELSGPYPYGWSLNRSKTLPTQRCFRAVFSHASPNGGAFLSSRLHPSPNDREWEKRYDVPPPLPVKNTQAMRSSVYWCNVGKWSLPCKPACPSKTLHKATGHSGHTNTPTEHIQTTQARTVIEQQQTPCYNDPWCVCLRTLALSLPR